MPELSRFYNIVIKMLFKDMVQHNKPHVHVFYNEYEASIGIGREFTGQRNAPCISLAVYP
jgi:hypothetical protein